MRLFVILRDQMLSFDSRIMKWCRVLLLVGLVVSCCIEYRELVREWGENLSNAAVKPDYRGSREAKL